MERPPSSPPAAGPTPGSVEDLELVIEPRARDLDGLVVARLLPAVARAGGSLIQAGRLALLRSGAAPRLVAAGATRALLLGGEPLGERRHAWWNFVSSSPERIEEAKAAWAGGRFPKVPGDEVEFTPLPARHAHPGATE